MINKAKERFERVEAYLADLIYDRSRGGGLERSFLKGLAFIYSMCMQVRSILYKNRILKSRTLGCLVVVVGNLTVGGTGKTPVVEKFARSLAKRGRKVAILSRGYKSKEEAFYRRFWCWLTHGKVPPPKIVSDGESVLLNSEVAGDEPYMLAKNLPGVIVIVDKDRVKAGRHAIEKFGVDTLILDDGFQYLRLKGQLNLLLIDKKNPFGNGNLLPRGILREPIKHLKRASYVFLTKSDGKRDLELEAVIKRYHRGVEIIECTHQPQYIQSVHNKKRIELNGLEGKRVAAFSAIAAPESFEEMLENFGAELVLTKRFVDHHRYTYEELQDFFNLAKERNVDKIITTEKDAVRMPEYVKSQIPFYYLRLEIEILKGGDDFEKAMSRVCVPKNEIKATRPAAV